MSKRGTVNNQSPPSVISLAAKGFGSHGF